MRRFLLVSSLLAIAACAEQPPPPVAANPPPPPPPPPPQTFAVYFDYNSAELGPSAKEILRLAADAYKGRPSASVQVTGYTDASGSAAYNQRLSLRRADAVAAELQSDSVPQTAVTANGQGETSNAATPGQDRRVDVVVGAPAPAS